MSRYNDTLIATAIRPDAKLGKLTVSRIGKYYAFTEDLDGFSSVEVKPQQLTPTERDFYCGNPYKRTQVLDETMTDIVLDVSASFPNLSTVVVGNTTQVVTGLDTMIGDLQGVTFVVPNSLQADYVVAYPNLTFTSWLFQVEFTIPFIGETTLTKEYVNTVVQNAGGDVNIVTKVIVPSGFTSYENGVGETIRTGFPSLTNIELNFVTFRLPDFGWEADSVDLILPLATTISPVIRGVTKHLKLVAPLWRSDEQVFNRNEVIETIDMTIPNARTCGLWFWQDPSNIQSITLHTTEALTSLQTFLGSGQALSKLTHLHISDVSNVTNWQNWTTNWLTHVTYLYYGNLKTDTVITDTALDHDGLITFLSGLYDFSQEGGTHTITMGSAKLALLSEAEKNLATAKGWTLQ